MSQVIRVMLHSVNLSLVFRALVSPVLWFSFEVGMNLVAEGELAGFDVFRVFDDKPVTQDELLLQRRTCSQRNHNCFTSLYFALLL